ncbi:MAG: hypothetical protein K1X63_14690 [Chitinophagales bacterium]|nr:hypothetical protein [Chitinophagales bacterium]
MNSRIFFAILIGSIVTQFLFSSCKKNDSGALYIPPYYIETFNQFNSGLPDSSITALAVDNENVLWIGVEDKGLVKYDGNTWEVFNKSNSMLPGNEITSIVVDQSNKIWVGTTTGLASFANNSWEVYFSNGSYPTNVSALSIDDANNLWVAFDFSEEFNLPTSDSCFFNDSYLIMYDGNTWTQISDSILQFPAHHVTALESVPGSDRLWIGEAWDNNYRFCDGGVVAYKPDSSRILETYYDPGAYSYAVDDVTYDPNGLVWTCSYYGVPFTYVPVVNFHVYDASSFEDVSNSTEALKQYLQVSNTRTHFTFSPTTIWAFTYRLVDLWYVVPRLLYYDQAEWHTLLAGDQNAAKYDFTCLAVANDDVLWAGTREGLLKIYK